MPDRPPSDFENQNGWMEYCVPFMMNEDMENDQAVAACLEMWRNKSAVAAMTTRAWSVLTVKSVDAEQRTIEGIATTPTVDRIGDIVEPLGGEFKTPLPLLLHHDHKSPVGHVTAARATKDGISIIAKFARIDDAGELKNQIDKAWQSVKAGLVRGLSIGFKPMEYEPIGKDSFGLRFTKWAWLELSLVTIPANADASIVSIRSADQAALGHTTPTHRPGATGKGSISLKRKERTMSKTIAEQVEGLQNARAAKEARMEHIMSKSMDDGRSTDESEQDEFDLLQSEVEKIDGDLKRFAALEKINKAKAQPVREVTTIEDGAAARGNGHGNGYIQIKGPEVPAGIRFARVAKVKALARLDGIDAVRIAEMMYGDDQAIVNIVKAAVPAATTTQATWALPLVSAEGALIADFLEYLRPLTVIGRFGQGNVPSLRRVPFRVPLASQTSGGAGYWTAEGAAKPLTKFDFARTTLTPLKVASICVVTEELLRSAALSAEELLRDQLASAVAARIDTDFLDPAKAVSAGVSPASITNGVTTIVSSGVDGDAVRRDLAALFAPFDAVNNPASGAVLIMATPTARNLSLMTNALGSPEFPSMDARGGSLAGYPVIVSDYVTTSGGSPGTRYVWLVDARSIWLGDDGNIAVDMSREASLQMDNAPTMHSGTPTAIATVSMFQTNSVAFRAEREINWAKARAEAVQGIEGVTWGS